MKNLQILFLTLLMALPLAAQTGADSAGYSRFRFGGYGEMVASMMNYDVNRFTPTGSARRQRAFISIPRAVLAFDYKFTSRWILGIEIEFEAGGTGSAVELETSENGEYETEIEKGGEVALEQFHITRLIVPAFNVRVGHLILPIGLTNAHHEPINFFGTSRPEAETTLLPSTWHATGLELFGSFGLGLGQFDYQALITAGLNANGLDRDEWIAGGAQGLFETDNFTSPAYSLRLDWRGVKNLRMGVSGYYCPSTTANADKPQHYAELGRVPVGIATFDVQYRNSVVAARANFLYGNVGNSRALNMRNGRLPNASPYSRKTPVASEVISAGAEAGFDILKVCGAHGKSAHLYPFVRYEYVNPQWHVASGYTADSRLECSKWTAGLNWFALPNLVVKADYTHRTIGGGRYNSESQVNIGVAYVGWFVHK